MCKKQRKKKISKKCMSESDDDEPKPKSKKKCMSDSDGEYPKSKYRGALDKNYK
jgi:hypothetical protein